jgi:hypothetical protein
MQTKLTKKKFSAQVLWFIPIIPALGRWRFAMGWEGVIMRPCLSEKQTKSKRTGCVASVVKQLALTSVPNATQNKAQTKNQ